MREEFYTSLAAAVLYPQPGYHRQLVECRARIAEVVPEAAAHLDGLVQATGDLTDEQFEELYTRTFDHTPSHALEIGWHLFGEDYHRGALLVRLRQELRRHKIAEQKELPDHLTHVLLLLGRMAPADALAFAEACVVPALEKVLEGLKRDESPYLSLLQCVAAVIDDSCGHAFEEIDDGSHIPVS